MTSGERLHLPPGADCGAEGVNLGVGPGGGKHWSDISSQECVCLNCASAVTEGVCFVTRTSEFEWIFSLIVYFFYFFTLT